MGTPGGAQGVSAAPILLKNLLHMRIKIIQGYHSPGDVILAMARHEVDGIVQSVGAPEGARRQWVESGEMRILFSMERERVAGLEAPTIFEFAKSEEQRQVLAFFSSSMELGRPLMAPPGVPAGWRSCAQPRRRREGRSLPAGSRRHGLRAMPQSGEEIAARVAPP